MQTITLGNRILAYRSYGRDVDGDRPPLVLVHGAGGHHLMWPPALRHLPHTATYAIDLPGHGASSGPACTTVSAYSEVIRDFVDALELPWFVLAGHSMGGAIALDFALAYEQRLAGIGLVGTGARLRVAHTLLEALQSDFEAATQMIVDYSHHPLSDGETKELFLQNLRECDPHVLYGDFVACHHFDVTDRVESLLAPTIIICGQQDQMTPVKHSQFLHRQIAGSQLHLVDGAGHNVMLEQAATVTAHFAAFLENLSLSTTVINSQQSMINSQ